MCGAGLAVVVGCGAPTQSAPGVDPPVSSGREKAEPTAPAGFRERLDWLRGHWVGEQTSETWVAVGSSLFGVGFGVRAGETAFFEVMIVDEVDGTATYTALPNGLRAVVFPAVEFGQRHAHFANLDHDWPKRIHYERAGDVLSTRLAGDGRPAAELSAERRELARSEELEEVDRRFAARSAIRGAQAWADTFDPEGALWTRRSGRIHGTQAIYQAMERVLGRGDAALQWQPMHSGLSPRSDMGFTAGRYQLVRLSAQTSGAETAGAGTAARSAHALESGSYVIIWQRQSDHRWQAVFDAGVPDRVLPPPGASRPGPAW